MDNNLGILVKSFKLFHFPNLLHSNRVFWKSEFPGFHKNVYLTFSISKRYNNLTKDLSQWTSKQEEIYSLIKSLKNEGLVIGKYLII